MRRITAERTIGEQEEIQRRILESIQMTTGGEPGLRSQRCAGQINPVWERPDGNKIYFRQDGHRGNGINQTREFRKDGDGRPENNSQALSPEERRQRKREEERQRRLRRECIVLGILAAILLVLLLVQSAANSRLSYGEAAKGRIMTAVKNVSGKILPDFGGGVSGQIDFLVLVNKDHAIPEDYIVNEHWLKNGRVSVADEMYDALSNMLTDGSKDGREFVVASGYRSAEYQQQLLNEDIERDMREYGMTWQEAYDLESMETMPAGHSEHETGLAVDIVALDYQMLDAEQEYTRENQWLRENCQEYGFILRYPKDKEDVTGISYEPWHFRYVGVEAAKEIMEQGITLEEYLEPAPSEV